MSIKKIYCTGAFVSIVFLLFLPSFLSTKLGTKAIVSILEKKSAQRIQLSKLHLSWLGPQEILHLELIDRNQSWFSSSTITVDNSLISLVFSGGSKNLRISDPKLIWEEKTSDSQKKPSFLYILAAFDSLQITNGSFKADFSTYPIVQIDRIHLKWDTTKDKRILSLQANSLQNQTEGLIKLEGTFLIAKKTEPFFTPLNLTVDATNLPSNLFTFFIQDSSIHSLIGSFFDCKFNANNSPAEQLYSFSLSSPLLKAQGKARWDKSQKKLFADFIPLSFTLTQESYDYVRSIITLPKLHLTEPSIFQGMISQCIANTKNTEFFPLISRSGISFDSVFTNEKLRVSHQKEISHISSLKIYSHTSENCISSKIQAKISEKKQGAFFANISWTKQIQSAEIKCQAMPSYLLEGLIEYLSVDKLCGPIIDAELHAKLVNRSGLISIECLSSYSSFSLEGQVQGETITLSKPFYCQMNKQAGAYICKEVLPLFSCLQPINPISFTVAAEETIRFSYPFTFMHLVIPSVEIEIGKALCHSQTVSKTLFNLLKINPFNTTLTFDLWTTPINMHIDTGLIAIERAEILLIGLYEIAIWGDVDIKNNLCKMKLGLPASTLRKAFKIPDLSDDYVLVLEWKGDLESPQINLKQAAAKIAELLICQQETTNPLYIFFPFCKPPPKASIPPAKHPFPWEQTTAITKNKKRKKFKQKEKPLKQLLKVLR